MEKKRNQVKRNSPTKTAAIGALLTIIGGFFLSYNYIQAKKVMAYDFMANAFYNGEEIVNIQEEEETKEVIKEEELPEEVTDEYIGYLTIPKINLTKGFLDKRSTENDVEKNILVVEGSGWKAFFNDLYRLEVNDTVYVTYKNKKYIYKIVNIYKQPKIGKLAIYRNYDKTTLTLITCTNNDATTQTIYISELISVEE